MSRRLPHRQSQGLRRLIALVAVVAAAFLAMAVPSEAATAKPGTKCTKSGVKQTAQGKRLVCVRINGRLVWRPTTKVAVGTNSSGMVTATASPSPSSTAGEPFVYVRYQGGPGRTGGEASLPLPPGITLASTGNIRFWIFDPENPTKALGATGLFRRPQGGSWEFVPINADGTYVGTWVAGEYSIDTVEPSGNQEKYERRNYTVRVSSNGPTEVLGLAPNSQGVFTLTVSVRQIAGGFIAENPCQLASPVLSSLNVGFPRRSDRLPAKGTVRAIIIPVSAKDLPGNGEPFELYRPLAEGVHDFFYAMSQGQLRFDFSVLNSWVSLGDSARQYNLGSWNSGDPGGYYRAAINAADPLVDYSLFDVVYLMSPTNVPSSYIAYGPAFPVRISTNDGIVRNGTISGADAYQRLSGAMWKWAAHETGHLFGMFDLYTIPPVAPTYGSWDLMSLNWSLKAIELNGWNRFTQGWLKDNQFLCRDASTITRDGLEVSLISMSSIQSGLKSLLVKLSDTKMLVVESRRSGGFDNIPRQEEGILIYTVDMTIPSIQGGYKTQRRTGSTAPDFTDALLKSGDSIAVEGIVVTVIRSEETAQVRLNRS